MECGRFVRDNVGAEERASQTWMWNSARARMKTNNEKRVFPSYGRCTARKARPPRKGNLFFPGEDEQTTPADGIITRAVIIYRFRRAGKLKRGEPRYPSWVIIWGQIRNAANRTRPAKIKRTPDILFLFFSTAPEFLYGFVEWNKNVKRMTRVR